MVYEGEMIRVASLPGMWERTVTVGSAGKTFSVTGWKLGWAYGPAHLIRNCQVRTDTGIITSTSPLWCQLCGVKDVAPIQPIAVF